MSAASERANGSGERWRPIVAALLDPRARRMLGEHLAATEPRIGDADRRRAEATLRSAGLLTEQGEVDEARLRALLAVRPPMPTGVDRWIVDGRIESWPSGSGDRDELLRWTLDRVLAPAERLDEREITERITRLTRDPLRMRRALVDAGLVEREPDGTDYRRAADREPRPDPATE